MRAIELIKEQSCPRTRAKECTCESIRTITESSEAVIAQSELMHSDKVKGTVLFMQAPGAAWDGVAVCACVRVQGGRNKRPVRVLDA